MLKTLLDYGYSAYQQYKQTELEKAPDQNAAQPKAEPGSQHTQLSGSAPTSPRLKVPVQDLRFNLSQERAELQHLLRNNLADAGLPPGTQIILQKTAIGTLSVEGKLSPEQKDRLEAQLNQSPQLLRLFNRVSDHQPTVEFVSNAERLSQTYGVNNQALQTIVSRDQSLNSLQDISLRLDELRRQKPEDVEQPEARSFGLAVSV